MPTGKIFNKDTVHWVSDNPVYASSTFCGIRANRLFPTMNKVTCTRCLYTLNSIQEMKTKETP